MEMICCCGDGDDGDGDNGGSDGDVDGSRNLMEMVYCWS